MNKFLAYALFVTIFSAGSSWLRLFSQPQQSGSGSSWSSSTGSGSWGGGSWGSGGGGGGHK